MKKKGFNLILLTFSISVLFISRIDAQPLQIGGGLMIGSDEFVGVKIRGDYGMDFLIKNLTTSTSFSLFFSNTPGDVTYNRLHFSMDVNYTLYKGAKLGIYALSGVNIGYEKSKWVNTETTISSETVAGFNAGIGGKLHFASNICTFSELKYIHALFVELSLGVLFKL